MTSSLPVGFDGFWIQGSIRIDLRAHAMDRRNISRAFSLPSSDELLKTWARAPVVVAVSERGVSREPKYYAVKRHLLDLIAALPPGSLVPTERVLTVENRFFGGNVGVTGLMVGEDLARTLASEPDGHRYLLPDVCLSGGRFLVGTTPADLTRAVEVVATDGQALRAALEPQR